MLGHDPLSTRALGEVSPTPVKAGAINRNVGPALPFKASPRGITVQAAETSVALTGSAATASAGTLALQNALALSGSAVTVSAGTVGVSVTIALTGSAVTTSAGTLVPGASLALSGQDVAADSGTLTVGIQQAQGQQVRTVGPSLPFRQSLRGISTVANDVTLALTGQDVTASAGSLGVSADIALTGSAVTASAGSLFADIQQAQGQRVRTVGPSLPFAQSIRAYAASVATNDVTVALTGAEVTASAGAITATISQAVGQNLRNGMFGPALDFQASPRSVYIVSPDVTVSLSGQAVTASAGSLGVTISLTASGQAVSADSGTIGVGSSYSISGQSVTVSAGTLAYTAGIPLAGDSVFANAGTISVSTTGDVTIALIGQSVAVEAGTITASLDYSAAGSVGAGRSRRRRRRLLVEIDGEEFEVQSVDEAQQLLDNAKQLALAQFERVQAQDPIRVQAGIEGIKKPKITTTEPELKAVVREARNEILDLYDQMKRDLEIRYLMALAEEEEEEETLIRFLM